MGYVTGGSPRGSRRDGSHVMCGREAVMCGREAVMCGRGAVKEKSRDVRPGGREGMTMGYVTGGSPRGSRRDGSHVMCGREAVKENRPVRGDNMATGQSAGRGRGSLRAMRTGLSAAGGGCELKGRGCGPWCVRKAWLGIERGRQIEGKHTRGVGVKWVG